MREIGGYIEWEESQGSAYHTDCLSLNCGRSALACLIQLKDIRQIALPYFLCGSIYKVCRKYGVSVRFYHINENFGPDTVVPEKGEYVYLVNYYGQTDRKYIEHMRGIYSGKVIVDNAQAFFEKPLDGVDTLYTCRKFFGVADGAYLYTDAPASGLDMPADESFDRMRFLFGRYERAAEEFYPEYVKNNEFFSDEPVKRMSRLTGNLLRGIDYEFVKRRRTENFSFLHERLKGLNRLSLKIPQGAFMYPLWIADGDRVRKRLLEQKIYIPTLWPDVLEQCRESDPEYGMAENILPLPVDQRYSREDMEYMAERLFQVLEEIKCTG